eukprot:COSAG06_NODE_4816_length_3933_cov_8.111633_4_plen_127_part_00
MRFLTSAVPPAPSALVLRCSSALSLLLADVFIVRISDIRKLRGQRRRKKPPLTSSTTTAAATAVAAAPAVRATLRPAATAAHVTASAASPRAVTPLRGFMAAAIPAAAGAVLLLAQLVGRHLVESG